MKHKEMFDLLCKSASCPPHILRLGAATIEAAIEQREAYDTWIVENERDVGESLVAYGAATDACLKATRALMLAEAQFAKRHTKKRPVK